MDRYFAAVDIGGTKITASIADEEGLVARVYKSTVKQGDEGAVPRQVHSLLSHLCRHVGIQPGGIEAVGINTASPFRSTKDGIATLTPTLCGALAAECEGPLNSWMQIPLECVLRGMYTNIRISNDCVSAVVAERTFGAGRGEDNLAYVTWSTGIGAGAYVDGHLLKGKNSNALHLGHIFLATDDRDQPRCSCGSRGHLEALVAGPALAREGGLPAPQVFSRCRAGNTAAVELVKKTARIFARGLVNLTCILDTRLIVIGGSVALNNWDLLEPLIRHEYYSCFPALTGEVRICLSALGKYVGDIAALSLVLPEDWIERYRRTEPWKCAPAHLGLEE
jgi:glucokinase